MRRFAAILCLLSTLIWQGCSTYEPKVQPFKLPEAYANVQRVADVYVGARAWDNVEEARAAFGFDIIGAGLLPVQVSFDNRGNQTLVIVPTQTFLMNRQQEVFPVLSDRQAYDRVAKGTQVKETVKGVTQGSLLGAATGALIGAAVGVVSGGRAGEYALRGVTAGAVGGGILGGVQGAGETQVPRTISQDLAAHNLQNTPIKPGELAYGLILFPREAGTPQSLRLQLQDRDTGQVYTLLLDF
ncbi:MAG: hypothetical protein M0P73_17860 [Syntrophobacterales bacterium]|jgi:hypothetical protein|nr:hypothetical protein [Syntrophobacterales bacterium]